jgi:DNA replication licensing factor MCM3
MTDHMPMGTFRDMRDRADGRLLLQPMSYLPAFDAALSDLVKTLHDPTKHKIAGNECR